MFKAVDPKVDIGKLEQEQMEFWRSSRVFERTTEGRDDAPKYVFYEGPPTANGKPGSHHVLARAFKDMFPRYKVMNGYYCLRRGGWDTHGLPVELAVEKELGITDKRQIEEYGVAEFNEKCRNNVFRHIQDWERLTERIAFWVDLDNAYVTFTNDYIESVWWILKQFWDKGLLYKGYKVVPYSPTSGTPLSSHEVSLGYKTIVDPSVFVRFPLRDKEGVYFLAWTTTPWTLPSNAALAVGENIDYVQVEGPTPDGEGTEQLILAEALLSRVLGNPDDFKVVKRYKGKDLLGMRYNPLYTFLPVEEEYAYVASGDFVSTADGTGIVHIAPAYGVDDLEVGRREGLPVIQMVPEDGRFVDAATPFKGMWFKDADKHIIKDLQDRGLMYRVEQYEHSYPHNWRDDTPLMYFARETWFIRATDYRQKMIDLNQTVKWVPEHIRDGRFGNWLDDLKEWALGRERYWGTPLPVWADDKTGDMLAIGSVQELSELAGQDLSELDLHRPYVDDITFPNPNGYGGTMRRVPEVIDVWFDSGAMQVAQWGYPHKNKEDFVEQYPADYICEAVDQTRGWFYSLHAIAAMLFEDVSFRNVICLGHILDEKGQKMSKSKGNIVDPWSVLDTHGADAFRWYLYTSGPPGEPRRFSVDLVGEVIKKFWLTLWNTYSFFVTYANIDEWSPDEIAPAVAERDLLDRWILSELHTLVREVTVAYEDYDAVGATRPIEAFVDELSNWYVRLSRRRFWKSGSDDDKMAAYATLYECLSTVAQLLAPSMPFLSEALYRNLVHEVNNETADSVHLSKWPLYNGDVINEKLSNDMALVQRLVSLGLAARNDAQIGIRQPLAKAQFAVSTTETSVVETYADLIMTELNVKSVGVLSEDSASSLASKTYNLKPLPQFLGRKYGKDFKALQAILRDGDQDTVRPYAEKLLDGESIQVEVNGKSLEVTPEEVEIMVVVESAEDYAVAEEKGYLAALDTQLTTDLANEGGAREVVRRIQNLRKDSGFEIDDRIEIVYQASEKIGVAMEQFADYIREETLADKFSVDSISDEYLASEFTLKGEFEGETLSVGVKRAD